MQHEKVLIIDGMALLFRHFFATSFKNQFMYNQFDIPTNGVQGVIRHVFKLVESVRPSRLIITWDMGKETVRNEWFPEYKSNRPEPPDELKPQFDYIKEIFDAMNIYQIGIKGYEADDLIGTLTQQLSHCIVVSGDKDLLQILNSNNEIWLTKKGYTEYNIYNYDRFVNEYKILPQQFIDVKALMGDPSDGYPGVKGIGEKTALKLIQTHDSVNNIISNLQELKPSPRNKIESQLDALVMSQKLAKIITDVPINIDHIMTESVLKTNQSDILTVLKDFDLRISYKYVQQLNLED